MVHADPESEGVPHLVIYCDGKQQDDLVMLMSRLLPAQLSMSRTKKDIVVIKSKDLQALFSSAIASSTESTKSYSISSNNFKVSSEDYSIPRINSRRLCEVSGRLLLDPRCNIEESSSSFQEYKAAVQMKLERLEMELQNKKFEAAGNKVSSFSGFRGKCLNCREYGHRASDCTKERILRY
jgi:hypothetical protein